MKNGFTLIEILVTITIVAFLLIVSIPAFRNYQYKNDLTRSADMVQSAIYETKNLSLAPQIDKQNNTTYYAINFDSGTNQMIIYEASSDTTLPSDGTLVKTFDLPNNIIFSDDTVANIYFSIAKQGKIVGSDTQDIIITISSDKLEKNNTKTIEVNNITGQVKMN